MEDIDLLKVSGMSSTGIAVIYFLFKFFKTVKGKRLVSSCCGHKGEMSVDIQDITPTVTTDRQNPLYQSSALQVSAPVGQRPVLEVV